MYCLFYSTTTFLAFAFSAGFCGAGAAVFAVPEDGLLPEVPAVPDAGVLFRVASPPEATGLEEEVLGGSVVRAGSEGAVFSLRGA